MCKTDGSCGLVCRDDNVSKTQEVVTDFTKEIHRKGRLPLQEEPSRAQKKEHCEQGKVEDNLANHICGGQGTMSLV